MSEPFEIGVSLALEDGISAGIESARREMALLRDVLNTGGVPVRLLRETAQRALAPMTPAVVQRDEAPGESRGESDSSGHLEFGTEKQRLVGNPDLRSVATSETAPTETPLRSSGLDGLNIVADQSVSITAGRAPTPLAAPITIQAPAVPRADTVRHIPAQTVDRTQVGSFAPQLPHGEQRLQEGEGPAMAEATAAISPVVSMASQSPSAPPFAEQTAQEIPGFGTQSAGVANVSAGAPFPVSAGSDGNVGWNAPLHVAPTQAAVAPVPQTGFDRSNGMDSNPASDAGPGAAPVAAAATQQGPTEGDVFLDGMLVGRWMSRLLSREAARASSGPTSFDARRGRLLPGPTVGG